MVKFLKFPKTLCSGLMYAFVIYTLQMILNGVEEGTKVQMLPFGPLEAVYHTQLQHCNRVELA